jgi:hypothetical protein
VLDEGWFWLISLDDQRTSVGFVAREPLHRTLDIPAEDRFWWAVGTHSDYGGAHGKCAWSLSESCHQ